MNYSGLVKKNILEDVYSHDLDIKKYSFFDMELVLQSFVSKVFYNEKTELSKYLLLLRCEYLINEVCRKPESNLTKALIGVFSVSPIVVNKSVCSEAMNVFLARDAARDFLTSKIMNDLGIKKNESCIIYFSRNNLKTMYGFVKNLINKHPKRRLNAKFFYQKMKKELAINKSFKNEALSAYANLEENGILDYKKINFVDTWASGALFCAIDFIITFCDEYKYENKHFRKRTMKRHHNVTFSVANDKKQVMVVKTYFDYLYAEQDFYNWWKLPQNFYHYYNKPPHLPLQIKSFDCGIVKNKQIRSWYDYYGVSLPKKIKSEAICELFTAQVYTGFNHFGSLNLGHPIEWDYKKKKIILSSSSHKIGNVLRTMFLLNAVIGYIDGYKVPLQKQKKQKTIDRPRILYLMQRYGLTRYKAKMLDKVLYDNCEHVVTCNSLFVDSLIRNIIITMDFFGYSNISKMCDAKNYNFQYYLNSIKLLSPADYAERLNILCEVYSKKDSYRMLLTKPYFFVKEVTNAKQMKKNLHRNIKMIVFDIDGTLTPIEEGIKLLANCIKHGLHIAMITGRPKSFCLQVAAKLKEILPVQSQKDIKKIVFYCSNGVEAFTADGTVYKNKATIPITTKKKLYKLFKDSDLKIVSERDYRIIGSYKGKDKNENRMLALQTKIINEIDNSNLGVYMIKWGEGYNGKRPLFNSIDICASSKKDALHHFKKNTKVSNYIVIGDDPWNSDREIIGENDISVEGYGLLKTKAVVNYFLINKN